MATQAPARRTGRKRETFRIIETHTPDGPSLAEINASLGDWYYGLLITGEFRKKGPGDDSIR